MALNQARNAWTAQFKRTAVQTTEVQNSFLFRSNPGFEDWRSQYTLVALEDKYNACNKLARSALHFAHEDLCQVSRANRPLDKLRLQAGQDVDNDDIIANSKRFKNKQQQLVWLVPQDRGHHVNIWLDPQWFDDVNENGRRNKKSNNKIKDAKWYLLFSYPIPSRRPKFLQSATLKSEGGRPGGAGLSNRTKFTRNAIKTYQNNTTRNIATMQEDY